MTMLEWFVYSNSEYYPWAEIVSAETPEEAARLVIQGSAATPGGVVVFPADAYVYTMGDPESGADVIQRLRDEGQLTLQDASRP